MDELVSFELGVVEKLFLAPFDRAYKHAFTVGHLVLAERALVTKLFETIFDLAHIDAVLVFIVSEFFVFGISRVIIH